TWGRAPVNAGASKWAAHDACVTNCREVRRLSPSATPCAPRASWTSALLRLRNDAHIRLGGLPAAGEALFRLLVGYGTGDDHIFAVLPIGGRRDLVLGGQLEAVENTQDL